MKRKLLIPALTSLALAPTIAMVGCGDPDKPEYKECELKKYTDKEYRTDMLNLSKDSYYKFYINNCPSFGSKRFCIAQTDPLLIDVFVLKVVANNEEIDFTSTFTKYMWTLTFKTTQACDIEIYLRCDEPRNGVCGWFN